MPRSQKTAPAGQNCKRTEHGSNMIHQHDTAALQNHTHAASDMSRPRPTAPAGQNCKWTEYANCRDTYTGAHALQLTPRTPAHHPFVVTEEPVASAGTGKQQGTTPPLPCRKTAGHQRAQENSRAQRPPLPYRHGHNAAPRRTRHCGSRLAALQPNVVRVVVPQHHDVARVHSKPHPRVLHGMCTNDPPRPRWNHHNAHA